MTLANLDNFYISPTTNTSAITATTLCDNFTGFDDFYSSTTTTATSPITTYESPTRTRQISTEFRNYTNDIGFYKP